MGKEKEPGVGSPTWWEMAGTVGLWGAGRPVSQGIMGVGKPRTPGRSLTLLPKDLSRPVEDGIGLGSSSWGSELKI